MITASRRTTNAGRRAHAKTLLRGEPIFFRRAHAPFYPRRSDPCLGMIAADGIPGALTSWPLAAQKKSKSSLPRHAVVVISLSTKHAKAGAGDDPSTRGRESSLCDQTSTPKVVPFPHQAQEYVVCQASRTEVQRLAGRHRDAWAEAVVHWSAPLTLRSFVEPSTNLSLNSLKSRRRELSDRKLTRLALWAVVRVAYVNGLRSFNILNHDHDRSTADAQ